SGASPTHLLRAQPKEATCAMQAPDQLVTTRLLLRPPEITDAPDIFHAYARDEEVTRYLVWRPHQSQADTEAFVERSRRRWQTGDEYTWAITLRATGDLIGMIASRVNGHKADIGYVLAKAYWRR